MEETLVGARGRARARLRQAGLVQTSAVENIIQFGGHRLFQFGGLATVRGHVVEHDRDAAAVVQGSVLVAERSRDHCDHLACLRQFGGVASEAPVVQHHYDFDSLAALQPRQHLEQVEHFERSFRLFSFECSSVDNDWFGVHSAVVTELCKRGFLGV